MLDPSPASFDKLDLVRWCTTYVSLSTTFPKSVLGVERVNELLNDRGMSFRFDQYAVENAKFGYYARIDEASEEDLEFYLAYQRLDSDVEIDDSRDAGWEALQDLESTEFEFLFDCRVEQLFSEESAKASSFQLPILPDSSTKGLPFDEIRGIRAVKTASDGNLRYSFILDRNGDGSVNLTTAFGVKGTLNPVAAEAALLIASKVAVGLNLDDGLQAFVDPFAEDE